MLKSTFLRAATAVMATTALVAATPAPAPATPPTMVQDVQRTATTVPPGGLITSFFRNQGVYCSIICPLLVDTGVTAVSTTLQTPGVFFAALPSDGLLRAIGAAAASVTGPTEAAALRAIEADAAIPAKRALNVFQTGVVGLLNVIPAASGGLPGVATALQQARQDTFDALNAPFLPNPEPTVMPRGVFQVAVVGAINVGAAIIFPAFNFFLAGAFQIPNAVAQELAASGNPVRAIAAGIETGARVVVSAVTVVADAVVTAVDDVREEAAGGRTAVMDRKPATSSSAAGSTTPKSAPDTDTDADETAATPEPTTKPEVPKTPSPVDRDEDESPAETTTDLDAPELDPTELDSTKPDTSHRVREATSHLRDAAESVVKKVTQPAASDESDRGTEKRADPEASSDTD